MHTIVRHGGHRLRRHILEVWDARGGGFYGFVATLTFLYLEATNLIGDAASLPSFRPSIGAIINWLVQNLVTGLLNVVWASIWPVKWIGLFGVSLTSAALLAGAYVTFRLIRAPVHCLLREPDEAVNMPAEPLWKSLARGVRRRGTRVR